MTDNPVNPAHYIKSGGIETIDYEEAVCADLPGDEAISVGNILKYVSRYRQKHPGDPSRDLRKARWYLDRLIEIVEKKTIVPVGWAPQKLPEGTGVIVAKNRKEDEEANAAVFKTNTARPGDVPGPRDRKKSDTDGWRDDYSNKGPNLKVKAPCLKCGADTGHWMSCEEYTGHF
jgi:hypothetical protein